MTNGIGAAFSYESVKDQLKWHGLSVKEHINTVLNIGSLLHLSNDDFTKAVVGESEGMSVDSLNKLAQVFNKGK